MKIHEQVAGTVAKIVPRVGDAFCYETIVLSPLSKEQDGYALLKPIKNKDGKYCDFSTLPCVLEFDSKDSGCVYRYKIDKMGYARLKGNDYFVVFSSEDVDIYNRRSQYRLPYLKEAEIQIGTHTKVRDCWIHDVSINGLSLSIDGDKDFTCDLNSTVYISFKRGVDGDIIYKVEGKVVRCEKRESDESYTTIGVYIDNPSKTWVGFVSRIQREELQRRNRYANK